MTGTMIERINSLRGMTVGQLREKYRDVFGEETRSSNYPQAHVGTEHR